jgi:hypothetical protein
MKAHVFLSLIILVVHPTISQAGYLELGTSANYRKSTIDADNFQESISYTGSISYYFWESSALELSYTNGYSQIVVTPVADSKTITETDFSLIGLDMVFSFAGRESMFQPYVKLGGAIIEKKIYRQIDGFSKDKIGEQKGEVPSAGLGFKLNISKAFSVKIGVDAWTSPLDEEPVTVDYAGRAGLSWFL